MFSGAAALVLATTPTRAVGPAAKKCEAFDVGWQTLPTAITFRELRSTTDH
jgi:hypothetical protein